MALSQLQCLDDNHVNPRTHESKPEFLYCENQRLAVEALLRDGREAFFKCLETRGLRGFLSDLEMETLAAAVEPYDPCTDLFLEDAEDDETPLSLHYWPVLSDTSVPQMDIGWPDCEAYRGVTRTTVYSQPPLDGQAHIKEIVRKMIAQAQRVIAVVMDVFTDVDIFRDLLDASFKRKVSVYILLERTALPHFVSMCQRANMHRGHLKNLRVRCGSGAEFYSRSSTRVRGQMGHRFMFIDGDKAVSGSYRFTWMSSRLDKNLITVVTGQAVDAFDKLFRTLWSTSSSVDLRQVATEPEPEPEPIPQPAAPAPPSAAIARKLHNPKYSLMTLADLSPIPASDAQQKEKLKASKNPEEKNKRGRGQQIKEALQEGPPLHPGLVNLEKACLIEYLPIWPEPDPPKDVIGFINIRDAKKPTQVHLQRSEMFETSQAIRFSSPFSMPKETLPEVAKPRQLPVKPVEMKTLQAAQDKTKIEDSQQGRASTNAGPGDLKQKGTTEQNFPASRTQFESSKDQTKISDTGASLVSNTHTNQDARQNTKPHQNPKTLPQSSPNPVRPSNPPETVTTNSPQHKSLAGSNTKKEIETSLNTHGTKENSTQPSHKNTNKDQHTQNSSEKTSNTKKPSANGPDPSSTSSLSENTNSSSSVPPPVTLNLPLPSSSLTPSAAPPVPKPRTIQLLLKDGITSDGKKLLEYSAVKKPDTSTERASEVQDEPAVITVVEALPEKQPEIVPERQNKRETQKDPESAEISDLKAPLQKESENSQAMKNEEAAKLCDDRIVPKEQPNVSIREPSEAQRGNIQELTPNDAVPKTLTSQLPKAEGSKVKIQMVTKAKEKAQTEGESAQTQSKITKTVTDSKTDLEKAPELNRVSDNVLKLQNKDVSETYEVKNDTQSTREGKHTPEKSLRLPLTDTHRPDLRSADKESRSLSILARSPTPDGLPLRTPTPESRTQTPDLRSQTPDFRTPTPSDEYISALEDSNLSTTSEEFYECCVSPSLPDLLMERSGVSNHVSSEDTPITNSQNAPTNKDSNRKTSSCETQSSPVPEIEEKKESVKEETAHTEEDGKGDVKRTEKLTIKAKESKETAEKPNEAPAKTPKKKKVLSQSAGEKLVDGGVTPGILTKEAASTGESKAKQTEGKKLLHTPSKYPDEQKGDRASSSSKLSGPTQPLSDIKAFERQPSGNCLPNKTDSPVHHGSLQVLNNISTPRKPPARPPPPVTSGADGRRQAEVSRSPQSLFTKQSDKQKHHTSLLHIASNSQPHLSSRAQDQPLSPQPKAATQSPFGLTFGRLYSLRDLRDKMSKLPAQSKRSSSVQGRKSSS